MTPSEYQIVLSSGELYVLAALLRFKSLYGIESRTAASWQTALSRHIRETVKGLENKKRILLELHGRLRIDPQLRRMVELLCAPNRIVLLSGNERDRKPRTMYVMEKDGKGLTLRRLAEDRYELSLYASRDIAALLCAYFDDEDQPALHERLSMEDVHSIQERIASFQTEEAMSLLRRCVSEPSAAERLYGVLAKTNAYMQVRFFERTHDFYEMRWSYVISRDGELAVTVSPEENDMVRFDSQDAGAIREIITRSFAEKGSVDP